MDEIFYNSQFKKYNCDSTHSYNRKIWVEIPSYIILPCSHSLSINVTLHAQHVHDSLTQSSLYLSNFYICVAVANMKKSKNIFAQFCYIIMKTTYRLFSTLNGNKTWWRNFLEVDSFLRFSGEPTKHLRKPSVYGKFAHKEN